MRLEAIFGSKMWIEEDTDSVLVVLSEHANHSFTVVFKVQLTIGPYYLLILKILNQLYR